MGQYTATAVGDLFTQETAAMSTNRTEREKKIATAEKTFCEQRHYMWDFSKDARRWPRPRPSPVQISN